MVDEPQSTFSLWRTISFDAPDANLSTTNERRVRLKKRPNQIYFLENRSNKKRLAQQTNVCRLTVRPTDLLSTTAVTVKHRSQALPIYFYCPRFCCGFDCCEVNGSFLAATLSSFAVILVVLSIVCNLECTQKRVKKIWRRITRHRRKVRRVNARRLRHSQAVLASSAYSIRSVEGRVVEKPETKRHSVCVAINTASRCTRPRQLQRHSTTRRSEKWRRQTLPIHREEKDKVDKENSDDDLETKL